MTGMKRKRTPTDEGELDEEEDDDAKMGNVPNSLEHSKKARLSTQGGYHLTARERELVKENEQLKEQLKRSDRTIERLETEADRYHEMIQRCLDVIEDLAE
jgi:predicted nuclease with TOPRIM domain